MRQSGSFFHRLALVALLLPLGSAFAACADSDSIPTGGDDDESETDDGASGSPTGGPDDEAICLLHNCNSDAECGACDEGRNTCLLDEKRCVACDADTGTGCDAGEVCSSWGNCVPEGQTCATDSHGEPTFTCVSNADCAACDPMHQVCDPASSKCVACTGSDTSQCLSTDLCIENKCSNKCPAACDVDNDCANCTGAGYEAPACNAHKCAECSPTYACPAGLTCSPQGTCTAECGSHNSGACESDADCAGCGGDATTCHAPINGGPGTCGPSAAGCSDLGNGVAVLPDPWDEVTNLCSNDGDCSGVGIELNVGKMLRDLTGIDDIGDANIDYGMNVCAAVTVGVGGNEVSCGVCVPCQVDTDCNDIDIDQVTGQAFGGLGQLAVAVLLDQIFGQNDHKVHMYCEQVAGGYGVCSPCPGFIYDCSVGTEEPGGSSGGGGSCDHDECEVGGALDASCNACAADVCDVDPYCCTNSWDATCVQETSMYCSSACGSSSSGGSGGSCVHDECDTGLALTSSCSSCADTVCNQDPYCCDNSWDSQCVGEAESMCGLSCGGSSAPVCQHGTCAEGVALEAACSPCATTVCGEDPYCCDTAWDATCVNEADSLCGGCI
jgi:hypothetical protein